VNLDEKRIQEIVERVMARLGPVGTPAAVPAARTAAGTPSPEPKRELNIPRGKLGSHPDPDSAVKAARAGFE